MKFKANAKDLLNALKTVNKFKKVKHPILKNVLLDLNGDKLTLLATDNNNAIRTSIKVQNIENGICVVPPKIIENILQNSLVDELKFNLFTEKELHIVDDCVTSKIELDIVDDYFKVNNFYHFVNECFTCRLDSLTSKIIIDSLKASKFSEMIGKIIYASTEDDMRPRSYFSNLQIEDNKLTLACTDYHRIAAYSTDAQNTENCSIQISNVCLKLIKSGLNKVDDSLSINLLGSSNDNSSAGVIIKCGNFEYICNTIDEYFPINDFLNKEYNNFIKLDTYKFLKVLKRLNTFSNPKGAKLALDIKKNVLELEVKEEDYKNSNTANISCFSQHYEDVKIGVNLSYITEIVKSFSGDTLKLYFDNPEKPILLQDKINDDGLRVILMPLKL